MLGAIVGAALVWLVYFPHWKGDAGHCCEAGMLLYGAGDPQYHCEFAERNHCDLRAVFVVGAIFSKERLRGRPRRRTRPISRGRLVWGIRSLSGWADSDTRSIRHETSGRESRTRFFRLPGKAARLGLCADTLDWTSHRRRAGLACCLRVLAIS